MASKQRLCMIPCEGTMFPRGADAYIDDINDLIPLTNGNIGTAIDTECGVSLSIRQNLGKVPYVLVVRVTY
ncbi:hypothetical protein Lal_00026733 [Lupinus albus]|nr:hypothetical protein Lal_00026733 [Lupinus albus]